MVRRLPGSFRSTLPFALASASLALLFWAAGFQLNQPYDGFEWNRLTGLVEAVDPLGPSAGIIWQSDVIMSINDAPAAMAPSIYADLDANEQLRIVLNRQGVLQSVSITLIRQPLGTAIARLSPLLVALAFWITGVGVMAFARRGLQAWLFFGFAVTASSTLAAGSLSAIGPAWSSTIFNVLVWFAGPISVHLHLHFPEEKPIGQQTALLASLYGLAFVGSLPFMILGAHGVRASQWNQLFFTTGRLFLAVCLLLTVGLIVNGYRSTSSIQARQRIRLIVLGGGAGLLLAIVLTILPGALLERPLLPYEYGFLFVMAIPISYAYAIVRHRLIQLERFLSRGAAYTLVFAVLAGIYLALTSAIAAFLPSDWLQQPSTNMILILVLAGTAVPIYRRIQSVVNWAFYGGWYDYRSAVERLTEGLESYRDFSSLANAITKRLRSVLRLESACAFIHGNEEALNLLPTDGCLLSQNSSGDTALSIPAEGAIALRLRQDPDPLPGESLAAALEDSPLTKVERLTLKAMAGCLLVPIIGSEKLLGVLALGARRGGEGFSAEDIGILSLVARHAASAIENVHLLLEVRMRAAEVEGLHKQLVRAREDERKILARELHDEAIQALIGLNYKLAQLGDTRAASLQGEVRQIVEDLRVMIGTLRPPALDTFGLVTAMRSHLRELSAKYQDSIRFDLKVNGDEERWFPEDVGLCLYRVMQEALANAEKHANARRVEVALDILPEMACLTVQDDGQGFHLPQHLGQFIDGNHFGLVGLRERLELVRGNLSIVTAPGEGTQLQATVPL